MPQRCLEHHGSEMVELEGRVLFDAHTNDEEFVSKNITGALEEKGITTSLVDYEFLPGTDIRDEIFGVLYNARRLIFVLSPDTLKDEQLMYRLSIAITVALRRQDNFLLICTRSNLDFDSRYLTTDVKTFLKNFVYLESEDENLSHRLWKAITFSNEIRIGEDRHIWHNGENIRLLED
ncbi:interleukin-1 receptor-like 1 [Mya arenaria]|uniref:interleukin-1 receptor-like 1 n=1 Tax=Mya arenaria TaxID=6604 RepID=UPI0022E573EA|nr:interleukin-1 receptor-like 1 [Mya arenaria]